jgi:hypothetical protein
MAECCCPEPSATNGREPATCSACRTGGKPVDSLTVKALLTETALRRFEPGLYRFCPDTRCEVVYFAELVVAFLKSDLRVPVWQKETPGRRTVCYCFGEHEADIRIEVERDGHSGAVDRVRAHIAAGRCACEVRNPRGACCLGDVTMAVDRLRRESLDTASRS